MRFTQVLAMAVIGLASSVAALPTDSATSSVEDSVRSSEDTVDLYARCNLLNCPKGKICIGGKCIGK
ncbi:unnamed protein product, partial [Clonostachys rosea f. rosea IK726]|uniref:Dickkopf N-terminal cysteine-rich domain-containing protein n=2 Tax=Bionectria ochroleuca TaxID=29856 RepID=A0A8H7NGW3_BIOOC